MTFVGLDNFAKLLGDPEYYASVAQLVRLRGRRHRARRGGWRSWLAALATQKIRGLAVYRTLLLWPYGIAPAVAGIIFLFIFHPVLRDPAVLPLLRDRLRVQLAAQGLGGHGPGHRGHRLDAPRLQHRLLPGRAPGHPGSVLEAADVDGAGPDPPLHRHHLPPRLADHLLPGRRSTWSSRSSSRSAVIDAVTKGGPGDATEILVYKAYKDGFIGLNLGPPARSR